MSEKVVHVNQMEKVENWMDDEEVDEKTKEIGNEDPDWGFAKGKPLRAEEIGDDATYKSIATKWSSSGKLDAYEKIVDEIASEGPNGYAAYRFAWNGDRLSQEICVRALGSYLGNDLHLEASLMSQVFKTSGVAGRPYGSAGGGCTVFVFGSEFEMGQGKKMKYKFDQDEGDAVSHILSCDLFVDPMCGLMGQRLGVLVGDVSMTVWNPAQRIADLARAIRRKLGIRGLRLKLRSEKVGSEWVMNIYTRGSGVQKREAVSKFRKGIDVDYDGWIRNFTLADGAAQAIKQNRTAGEEKTEKRYENLRTADGREMKIFKLKVELAESAELQKKVEAQCTVFGALEKEMYFGFTKDGTKAWAKATYVSKEDASRANDKHALSTALSTEEFADADEGFVQTELVDAEFEIQQKASKAASKTDDVTAAVLGRSAVGNYKKAATDGDVKSIDVLIARVLESGKAMKVVKDELKVFKDQIRSSIRADMSVMMNQFKLTVKEETVAAVKEGMTPIQKVLQSIKAKKVAAPDTAVRPVARKRTAEMQSSREQEKKEESATAQMDKAIEYLKQQAGGAELMATLFPAHAQANNTVGMDWDEESE